MGVYKRFLIEMEEDFDMLPRYDDYYPEKIKRGRPKKIKPAKDEVPYEKMCCQCSSKATRFYGRRQYCFWHWCEPGNPGSW